MQTGLWQSLRWGLAESAFGESLESGGRFCVGAFDRNLASVALKMFSHLIYFIKKLYKFCISTRFEKIILQEIVLLFNTQKVHPVNFDGLQAGIVYK
jgi:hypothetical protein